MEIKDFFYIEGFLVVVKGGECNLFNIEVWWVDSFKDKDGNENIVYKFILFYLQVDDWVVDND